MPALKVIGEVSASHRLEAAVPPTVSPGPVEIWLVVPGSDKDETGEAWMEGVAREWHDELRGSRTEGFSSGAYASVVHNRCRAWQQRSERHMSLPHDAGWQ